jgi:DNA-binding transcriptional ArsR family regulator
MSAKQPAPFDLTTLAFVADYFKVFSESSRLHILHCLQAGPMNVMELTAATGLGQANLSKHLKVLTQAGILSRQAQGTSAYYEIIDPIVFEFCELAYHRIGERLQQQAASFRQLRTSELNSKSKK